MATAEINGALALLLYLEGELISVCHLLCGETTIQEVRFVRNPDKLRHLQQTMAQNRASSGYGVPDSGP